MVSFDVTDAACFCWLACLWIVGAVTFKVGSRSKLWVVQLPFGFLKLKFGPQGWVSDDVDGRELGKSSLCGVEHAALQPVIHFPSCACSLRQEQWSN